MIDWGRVASLRAEIGASDFAEVVEMFLEEAEEVVARLSARRPSPSLEAELHFLKGAALNLGFADLAGLCDRGEKSAGGGGQVDLAVVVQCYRASRQAFEAGLRGRNAA